LSGHTKLVVTKGLEKHSQGTHQMCSFFLYSGTLKAEAMSKNALNGILHLIELFSSAF